MKLELEPAIFFVISKTEKLGLDYKIYFGILNVKYHRKIWVSQYGLLMAFNNILVHGAI